MVRCSVPSTLHQEFCRSCLLHRRRLCLWLHHCLSAKPCDSYQETWPKRPALPHKGRNNALQLGHEIYSDCSMWSDREDAGSVCVLTHRRVVTVNKFCKFLLNLFLHHLMVWPQSPTENKMHLYQRHRRSTPLKCNDATLGVIVMCCS